MKPCSLSCTFGMVKANRKPPHCRAVLQEKGYDPVYGARPVKRAVQRELETALAKGLLRGEFGEDDTVVVEAPGGAHAKYLTLSRKAGYGAARPIVDDSLDIDVSRDSYGNNGAGDDAEVGARF